MFKNINIPHLADGQQSSLLFSSTDNISNSLHFISGQVPVHLGLYLVQQPPSLSSHISPGKFIISLITRLLINY